MLVEQFRDWRVQACGQFKQDPRDVKHDPSNEYSIVVGETENEFTFSFKVESIKIIPSYYDVVVSEQLTTQCSTSKYSLRQQISLEPDSTFV
jgi:hypothetical protein